MVVAGEPSHEAGHEARPEILEGQRRPVEKLEDVFVFLERHEGRIEVDGVRHHGPQIVFRDRTVKERRDDVVAHLREGPLPPVRPEPVPEDRHALRHVEPVVRRQGPQDRLFQVDEAVG